MRQRVKDYRLRIRDLEAAIDALTTQSKDWLDRSQAALDQFYLDLSGLYYRKPGTLERDPSRDEPL